MLLTRCSSPPIGDARRAAEDCRNASIKVVSLVTRVVSLSLCVGCSSKHSFTITDDELSEIEGAVLAKLAVFTVSDGDGDGDDDVDDDEQEYDEDEVVDE